MIGSTYIPPAHIPSSKDEGQVLCLGESSRAVWMKLRQKRPAQVLPGLGYPCGSGYPSLKHVPAVVVTSEQTVAFQGTPQSPVGHRKLLAGGGGGGGVELSFRHSLRGAALCGRFLICQPCFSTERVIRSSASHFHFFPHEPPPRYIVSHICTPTLELLLIILRLLFQPRKLGFSHFGNMRKKKFDESTDYICPMEPGDGVSDSHRVCCVYRGLSPLDNHELDGLDQVGQIS